jgi:hypothetical protein
VDQPKIKWEKLLETLEGSSAGLEVDTFIHHFWLSSYDYLAAKRLFKVLKRRIGKDEAKGFLDALLTDASLYRGIHEMSYWKWSKEERRIVAALDALQLFRVQQQTPCVLSLMRCFKEKKLKKAHFEDAVVAIEKFHFLFTAVTSQRSSGGISEMYASLGRRLFEATDTQAAVAVVNEIKTKLRERVPVVDEVKALFPSIIYTENQTKQRNLVKYILAGLQRHSLKSVAIDFDAMTIEHLAPQSLKWTPSLRPRDAIFKLVFREAARVSSLRVFTRVLNPFGKERATIHMARRPPSPHFGVPKITAVGGLFSRSGSELVFFDPFDLSSNGRCDFPSVFVARSHRFPSGWLATVALC